MKKIIILVTIVLSERAAYPQVAINTDGSQPQSTAILDVKSTTKGMLIPRMTKVQREQLAVYPDFPTAGLMVYQTNGTADFPSGFYIADGVAWKHVAYSNQVPDNAWAKNGTSVYNLPSSGAVGIGTLSPDAKLEINAVGYSEGLALQINDESPMMQMKSNGVDKGFVQITGDNLRIGVNATNTNGKFVVRTSGDDQFTVDGEGTSSVLGEVLYVQKKVTRNGAPSENFLPIAYGSVAANGTLEWASPLASTTVTKFATGGYRITLPWARVNARSAVIATAKGALPRICSSKFTTSNEIEVYVFDTNGINVDGAFSFIINDPLNL